MQIAIVVYRNPAEQWLWESGFIPWCAAIALAAVVLFFACAWFADMWTRWQRKRDSRRR